MAAWLVGAGWDLCVCVWFGLSCVVAVGCAAVVQGDAPGLFMAAMLRLTTRDRQQNLTASCMRQVEKQFAKPHGVEQGREVVSACTSHQHSLKVRSYAFTNVLWDLESYISSFYISVLRFCTAASFSCIGPTGLVVTRVCAAALLIGVGPGS